MVAWHLVAYAVVFARILLHWGVLECEMTTSSCMLLRAGMSMLAAARIACTYSSNRGHLMAVEETVVGHLMVNWHLVAFLF